MKRMLNLLAAFKCRVICSQLFRYWPKMCIFVNTPKVMINIINEVSRCLLCNDAPCTRACTKALDPARGIRSLFLKTTMPRPLSSMQKTAPLAPHRVKRPASIMISL